MSLIKKTEVNIPCIICGSNESKIFFRKKYTRQNYPGHFYIRKCFGCGLYFNSPRLTNDELDKFYSNNYYVFQRPDSHSLRRACIQYFNAIQPIEHMISSKNVLEIGSAKGWLLAILSKLGWSTQGIELSPEASEFSKAKLGLKVFSGTIEQFTHTKQTNCKIPARK